MPRVCVFDVIETLLDLSTMDGQFGHSFADGRAARMAWFQQVLQSAMLSSVVEDFSDFGAIGDAALQMSAAREEITLTVDERREILGQLRSLHPYPDVRGALERLRGAGLRLVTLSNAANQMAETQLARAGLRDFFDAVYTTDMVRRHKPAPEAYRMVAEREGVAPGQLRLVAAHSWDVTGALHAGCAAALVLRPGLPPDPLGAQPDVVGEGMTDITERILEAEGLKHA